MATTKLMTAEDLYQFEGDQNRYDLIRGELITMSPATYRRGIFGMRIARRVADFADEYGLGEVPNSETGFILARDPDVLLAPDVAFVRNDQLPPVEEQYQFLELAPDLVVEVVSPSELSRNVHAKVMEYLAGGVRLVWVVEPERKDVTVYTPDRTARVLTIDEELEGGDVLTGFRMSIAEIFR